MTVPIEKSLDDIRNDLFGRIATAQADGHLPQFLNLNKGVVRGLIEIWAWGLYQLYQFMVVVFGQLFPTLATGTWLDLHCKQVGVTRQKATRAFGMATFFREGNEGNVSIPMGTVVRTKPDGAGEMRRFLTTASVVLPDGKTSIAAEVQAQEYGRDSNVTAGMIAEIVTPVSGIDGVANTSDWLITEAVDNETDEALRERYTLAWKNINGSTKYAYESWARSVAGVVSAKIMDMHPRGQGTVDVVIKGSAGMPTDALISEVKQVVAENRPVNDDALVRSPTPVSVIIDVELVLVSGTAEVITATVASRINAMFTDPGVLANVAPIEIGEDLTMDRITHVIMAVAGIKKINFVSPVEDIQVPDNGLAVLESQNISFVWADEA